MYSILIYLLNNATVLKDSAVAMETKWFFYAYQHTSNIIFVPNWLKYGVSKPVPCINKWKRHTSQILVNLYTIHVYMVFK